MPNELVRLRDGGGGDKNGHSSNGHGYNGRNGTETPNALGHGADTSEEWDLPPEQMGYGFERDGLGPEHGGHTARAASLADDDAARARARGDGTFAAIREADAADLRQTMWDWGDLKTWLWIGGMCAVFLLMVALCYFLPYGRHASPPPIRVY